MGAAQKQKMLRETLTNKFFDGVSTPDLLARPCPHCHSEDVAISHQYEKSIMENAPRGTARINKEWLFPTIMRKLAILLGIDYHC